MTAEQQAEFKKFVTENLPKPEKRIDFSDVEWNALMANYYAHVGTATLAFMEGFRFAESKYKPKHIYPDEMSENF